MCYSKLNHEMNFKNCHERLLRINFAGCVKVFSKLQQKLLYSWPQYRTLHRIPPVKSYLKNIKMIIVPFVIMKLKL